MVNLCKNRVRLGSKKIRVRLVAGTTLRGYDLTSILIPVLQSQTVKANQRRNSINSDQLKAPTT